MTVFDIYNFLDSRFPFSDACEWDNSGLLIGDKNATVTKAIIALDCTDSVIAQAKQIGAELIITHHPIIFPEINSVLAEGLIHRVINSGISVISAHTNLDKAKGGVNDCLAKALGLKKIKVLHTKDNFSIRIGELGNEMSPQAFAGFVGEKLNYIPRFCVGNRNIKRVAVCGGSGGDFLDDAIKANADAYVTADVKHHVFLNAAHHGITLIDGGHFATEDTVIEPLRSILQKQFPDILFTANHLSVIR